MKPYFSIVIPLFNREHQIARSIDSCLNQDFASFEIVVVDDGSTDASAKVVSRYTDSRLTLIRHEANRGVSPARNTGIAVATGEWLVFLDSDDELVPGALSIMYARSLELGDDVSRMQFMGRRDSGELSPDPPLQNERWDYTAYVKMMEITYGRRQDWTPVARRSTFEHVRFNDNRSFEGLYHLDFHRRFVGWAFPDVVALYHQDAENQLTKSDPRRTIAGAHDQAVSTEILLKRHGDALRMHAPRIYAELLAGMATLGFLSGNRLLGMKRARAALANDPLAPRIWVILAAGLLGPRPLAWLKSARTRWMISATSAARGKDA